MFDALKSMVWEETPADKAAKAAKAAQQAQQPPAPAIGTAGMARPAGQPMSTYVPQGPAVNQAMVDAIKKAIFARTSPFTTLLSASDQLLDVIADQTTRLKAAFKMSSGGRQPAQILQAVDMHVLDVGGEERAFKAAMDAKINTEVGALETQLKGLRTSVDTQTQQIVAWETQIQTARENIARQQHEAGDLEISIGTRRSEFDQANLDFKAAADAVRDELAAHKIAIQSSLA